MAKARLKLVAPTSVNRTVPRRPKNKALRTREHLTEKEVERLIKAVGDNRHGHRDATMVLIAFRHGLRASELCDLRWDQVDFTQAVLHVRRAKNGTPSTHPLTGCEMRALRRLQREAPLSPFIFVSERGAPFTTAGFARMLERGRCASTSRCTLICCGTLAVMRWPTKDVIPVVYKPTSAIDTSSTPRGTRSYRPFPNFVEPQARRSHCPCTAPMQSAIATPMPARLSTMSPLYPPCGPHTNLSFGMWIR